MSRLARRDTKPEILLRSELHRRGLRYRVQVKVPGNNRRTIDIAFTRVRLAVYVDGCFWHGCPEHHVHPRATKRATPTPMKNSSRLAGTSFGSGST